MADPKLRFKGFLDSWKSSMFGDLSSKVHDKNYNLVYKTTFTNSAEFGIIDQLDFFDHNISKNNNISNYTIVKDDYFVYNPRISVTAPVGPINRNKLGYTGVMSPLYYVFNVSGIDKTFLEYYFKTTVWHKYLKDNGNSGARHDRLSITDDLFSQMPILHPSLTKEQLKIADFFQNLDNQIKIQFKTLDRLKRIKLSLMVAMFPQNEEPTPRVRFKGFDEPWRPCKLNSFAKRITRKNTNLESTRPLTISAEHGLIDQTDFFNSVIASDNLTGYYLLKKGEFAYNKSYSNRYPFGAVKRLDNYEIGVISNLYIVFEIKGDVSSDFISQYFETNIWHREVAIRAAEGARNHGLLNIGAEDFFDINIQLPHSLAEQQKIAEFFRNLDRQIECQTQILERLKRVKAACLDQMFV